MKAIGEWAKAPQKVYDTFSIRSYKPIQPQIIKYLNTHKHGIHPWLYKEAVIRGVI